MHTSLTILFIGGVFTLIGILLLVGRIYLFRHIGEKKARCTASTWATVTEMRPVEEHTIKNRKHGHRHRYSISYHRVFEFNTADGKTVQVVSPSGMYYQEAFKVKDEDGGKTLITPGNGKREADLANRLHREIGWQTQIRYNPDNPEEFIDPDDNGKTVRWGGFLMSIAAMCCLVPGLMLLITGGFLASMR